MRRLNCDGTRPHHIGPSALVALLHFGGERFVQQVAIL
jgi:hypothetical protein